MLAWSPKSEVTRHAATSAAAPAPALVSIHREHPERAAVERFIRTVYAGHYGADVRQFAPHLVALHDADGEVVAAAGYRPAAIEPLFLECYLPAAVEKLLGDAGQHTERARIVEVGHLASGRTGAGRRLIGLLGPHLAQQGYQWAVSTVTEELHRLFLRMGLAPTALGAADPAALGADAAAWGSYYDHRPLVLAGQIDVALVHLVHLARRSVLS